MRQMSVRDLAVLLLTKATAPPRDDWWYDLVVDELIEIPLRRRTPEERRRYLLAKVGERVDEAIADAKALERSAKAVHRRLHATRTLLLTLVHFWEEDADGAG
jgi:hypothetical protein